MKTPRELLLMAAAVLLNGCTSDLDGAPCPCVTGYCCWGNVCRPDHERECQVNIAFVPKASDNPVFRVAYAGAQQAVEGLNSVAGRPRVELSCVSPQHLDSEEQRAAIEQVIDSKQNGLVVSCLDPNVITPALNKADAMGIPAITFDSDCPLANRIAFYGMDNERSGSKAAQVLVEAMAAAKVSKNKSVAILTGGANAVNLEGRVDGFNDRLHKDYPDVQVIQTSPCNETADDCGGVIEGIIQDHPDLDGLFITGLWGLQAACSCHDLGCKCDDRLMMPNWKTAALGTLRTVSYDTLPFELELVHQGYVSALISQDYRSWGYRAVTLMFEYLTEGQRAKNFVDSEFQVYRDDDRRSPNWVAPAPGTELSECTAPPKQSGQQP